jgi:tetratricopeptide (TPR) repeat protein
MKVRFFLIAAMLITTAVEASTFANDGLPDGKPLPTQSEYGNDSVACLTNISLYRALFKQWKDTDYSTTSINQIVEPWKWVFNNCPAANENTYIDGVKLIQYSIENEANPVVREQYLDTLMYVYDQQIKYFPNHFEKPQEGAILGRKGIDLLTYNEDRYEEAFEFLHKSVELEGGNTDGTVMVYYLRSVIKMARNGKVDSTFIVDVYEKVMQLLDHNINTQSLKNGNTQSVEIYKNFKENIDATFEPFASCGVLTRMYKNRLLKTPDDIALLRKITAILSRCNCQSDSLYVATCMNLHTLEPSPESAYNIGQLMLKDERLSESLPFFEMASNSTVLNISQTSYKKMSEIYRTLKNYPSSKQMALKAIALNPNDGEPFITIGNLYAASATDCGTDDFSSKATYWAAVDKFVKAGKVDPSVANVVNELIASYSASFPTKETILFNNYKVGGSYTVECWFTEQTIIRAAK